MNSSTTQKAKAPTVAAAGALKNTQKQLEFSSKSTATEAQLHRLVQKLRARSHHTTELRQCGIHHPAGRVQDLEARGFVIDVSRITTIDAEGFSHSGVALYSLVSEPDGQQPQ